MGKPHVTHCSRDTRRQQAGVVRQNKLDIILAFPGAVPVNVGFNRHNQFLDVPKDGAPQPVLREVSGKYSTGGVSFTRE